VSFDIFSILLRENDRVQDYIVRSCQDLTDEQVSYSNDNVDERWIGNIVSHLYGNVANQVARVSGDQPQQYEAPKTTAQLLAFAEEIHTRVADGLKALSEAQLEAKFDQRGREVAGLELIMNGYSHAFRHVGNILDARHLGGFETHALG
jgi:hypothetical protein